MAGGAPPVLRVHLLSSFPGWHDRTAAVYLVPGDDSVHSPALVQTPPGSPSTPEECQRRGLTRSITFLPCSSAGAGGRVCAAPACRATTPSGTLSIRRRPSWTARLRCDITDLRTPAAGVTCETEEGLRQPGHPHPLTPCRAATKAGMDLLRVGDSVLISWL